MQAGQSLMILLLLLLVAATAGRQLLLVSLDGFRHDYLTKYTNETTFLRRMASEGVLVRAMTTEFLTKTFPNHWTMVTGLHQESHGIVSNSMYDPEFNASFNMSTEEERWWNDSLPIWITAKRQRDLKSATLSWPGGAVSFSGVEPDFIVPCSYSLTGEQRVNMTLQLLSVKKVDLCALYFSELDSAGHRFGPNSVEVSTAIGNLDFLLRKLIDGLEQNGIKNTTDVIITSDHGMSELSDSRVINFNGTLDPFVDRYMDSGPLLSMFAKAGMKDQLVEFLQNETHSKNLPIRVYTKQSLPERFHYSKHRRIPDVLVLTTEGYAAVPSYEKLRAGLHGYDNIYDEMKVPLIAFGPSFKRGAVVSGFRQVDIYGLMCRLLRITPQPNNGSLELLPQMLSSSLNLRPV